jgi:hypothetical protein
MMSTVRELEKDIFEKETRLRPVKSI